MALPPIAVDLDGTLIRTDMLHETALLAVREDLVNVLRMPLWLARGKAWLKKQLAARAPFDPQLLPYNQELIGWLKEKRLEGHRLVLCTASDKHIADAIAAHLAIFDDVIASDGALSLSGSSKAAELEKRFGREGYDYAGNSTVDLRVWEKARGAIVVNAPASLAPKVSKICKVEKIFPPQRAGFAAWRKMLRLHQWMKNLLLFAPLFAAHNLDNMDAWLSLVLAFFSFGLCASSVYISNDLLDLESDRLHPRKKNRPFASGRMPIALGVALVPLLLALSVVLGYFAGGKFLPWMLGYFVLTCLYSLWLKRLILADCFALAILYTLRIIAGAATVGQELKFWLLAFSIFLFLSLAFVKRYAEMEVQLTNGKQKVHGRGYHTSDAPLIQALGLTVGCVSALVLALYLNTDVVLSLYRVPELVWIDVPVMLFWISWIWMQAHRGNMHDDPVIFAVKDKVSLLAGAVFAVFMVLGTTGLPW